MNITEYNNMMLDLKKYDLENEIVWFYAIEKNGAVVVPVAKNILNTEFFDLRTGKYYSQNSIFDAMKTDYFLETYFCQTNSASLQKSLEDVCIENDSNKEVFQLISKTLAKDKKIAFPVIEKEKQKLSKYKLIKKANALENIFGAVHKFQHSKSFKEQENSTLSR